MPTQLELDLTIKPTKSELKEFQKMLDQHDWYFAASEDHRVYRRGREQREKIISMTRLHKKYEEMYRQKVSTLKMY